MRELTLSSHFFVACVREEVMIEKAGAKIKRGFGLAGPQATGQLLGIGKLKSKQSTKHCPRSGGLARVKGERQAFGSVGRSRGPGSAMQDLDAGEQVGPGGLVVQPPRTRGAATLFSLYIILTKPMVEPATPNFQ